MYVDPGGDPVYGQKLTLLPLIGITAHLVANLHEAFVGGWRAVALEFFSAANHREEQEAFQRRAALEIEALTSAPLPSHSDDDWSDDDEDDD